jgi:hypothetical protein
MHRRPPKTARQRADERGWVFRPLNPMPELILRAAYAHQAQRAEMRKALHSARAFTRPARGLTSVPGMPVGDGRRILAYYKQNDTPRRPLTPRQQRRRRRKDPSLRTL